MNNLGEDILNKVLTWVNPNYKKNQFKELVLQSEKLIAKNHCDNCKSVIKQYFRDIFTVLDIIEEDKLTIVYFIYESKYCRLCVTENQIYAKFLP